MAKLNFLGWVTGKHDTNPKTAFEIDNVGWVYPKQHEGDKLKKLLGVAKLYPRYTR